MRHVRLFVNLLGQAYNPARPGQKSQKSGPVKPKNRPGPGPGPGPGRFLGLTGPDFRLVGRARQGRFLGLAVRWFSTFPICGAAGPNLFIYCQYCTHFLLHFGLGLGLAFGLVLHDKTPKQSQYFTLCYAGGELFHNSSAVESSEANS